MNKNKIFQSIFALIVFCGYVPQIFGHGFSGETMVSLINSLESIESISRGFNRNGKDPLILTKDVNSGQLTKCHITTAAHSKSNCYLILVFPSKNVVICTPSQEFYRQTTREWVPAYKLKISDKLLTASGTVQLADIKFIRGVNTVFMFDLECGHTFLVSRLEIVTHNMAIPLGFGAGFAIAFGEGAAAGGAAGSTFGPVTLVGGFVLGGIAGVGIYYLQGQKSPTYALGFNPNQVEDFLKSNMQEFPGQQNNNGNGNNGGGGQDPNGPKKPNGSGGNDGNGPKDSKLKDAIKDAAKIKAAEEARKKLEEMRNMGSPSRNDGIREVPGNANDAFDFFKGRTDSTTIREVKPGVFVGSDSNGVTFTYRGVSKSGPPTIDINGVEGIRKIKFLDI